MGLEPKPENDAGLLYDEVIEGVAGAAATAGGDDDAKLVIEAPANPLKYPPWFSGAFGLLPKGENEPFLTELLVDTGAAATGAETVEVIVAPARPLK